jgi:hypothetical protein
LVAVCQFDSPDIFGGELKLVIFGDDLDVFGTWDFHVSQEVDTVDLFQTNEVCTHKRPNHIQIVAKDH